MCDLAAWKFMCLCAIIFLILWMRRGVSNMLLSYSYMVYNKFLIFLHFGDTQNDNGPCCQMGG
jgi:hypothetical protein